MILPSHGKFIVQKQVAEHRSGCDRDTIHPLTVYQQIDFEAILKLKKKKKKEKVKKINKRNIMLLLNAVGSTGR